MSSEPINRVRKTPVPPAWLGGSGPNLYYGETHRHSRVSRCGGDADKASPAETFQWMRQQQGFDFAALTDHDSHLATGDNWPRQIEITRAAEQPGRFATLPGFEWTSDIYGHRNVFFARHANALPLVVSSDDPIAGTPQGLERTLRGVLGAESFLVCLNHPAVPAYPCNLDRPAAAERLVEFYSGGRDCESVAAYLARVDDPAVRPGRTVQDALLRGLRLGFVSGSDLHHANRLPENYTGAYADSLDCAGIFAALSAGRTVAGRGKRSALWLSVNGFAPGETIGFDLPDIDELFPLEIRLAVRQVERLARVRLMQVNYPLRIWQADELPADDTVRLETRIENPFIYNNRTRCHDTCLYAVAEFADGSAVAVSPVYIRFRP